MHIATIPFSAGGMGKTIGCEKAIEPLLKSIDKSDKNTHVTNININNTNFQETNEIIAKSLSDLAKNNNFPDIIIGGDHSITYGCFKSFAKSHMNSGIVIFDAHPDVENNFSPPTHEDYLKVLIEENILPPENIILVGLREGTRKEMEYLKEKQITYIDMDHFFEIGLHTAAQVVMENARKWDNIYVSIDIDAVDPAFAPGTGYICPGGMSSYDLLYIIGRLTLLKNFRCADLVEINPNKDQNGMTIALGRKILATLGVKYA